MNLYRISQTQNDDYDTYDSAVVCAESEEEARDLSPDGGVIAWDDEHIRGVWFWCDRREAVKVEYLGELDNEQITTRVICCSFNAG